ncbi:MAG: hypothetical protein WBA81_00670, partial [Rhodococcus sp. (in: high G+C Gram-positive bacteria)]
AKAAEARRLNLQAETRMGDAATSRDELDAEYARANKIDPDVKRNAQPGGARDASAEKFATPNDARTAPDARTAHDAPGAHDARHAQADQADQAHTNPVKPGEVTERRLP